MFPVLFLLFFILPLAEVFVLLRVGSSVGFSSTILLILFTGILGAYLARQQGLKTMFDIQRSLNVGRMPADSLMDGAMILVAGALLVTPGFITDIIGFALLIPSCRGLIKIYTIKHFENYTQRKKYDNIRYFDQDDV